MIYWDVVIFYVVLIFCRKSYFTHWGSERGFRITETVGVWWWGWRRWSFSVTYIRILFCLLPYINIIFDIIKVLALIWMMSTSGQEWKTPKLWSQLPETPAPDSRCLPKFVKSYYSHLTLWMVVAMQKFYFVYSNVMFCMFILPLWRKGNHLLAVVVVYLDGIFFQEMKLMFPGAQRMNRGNHEVKTLVHACKANNVNDLVIVHETRGQPGMDFNSFHVCPFWICLFECVCAKCVSIWCIVNANCCTFISSLKCHFHSVLSISIYVSFFFRWFGGMSPSFWANSLLHIV